MADQLIRRIVTANTENGRSHIAEDALLIHVKTVGARPGYRMTNIWATGGPSADIAANDGLEAVRGVMPPREGTVLRVIDFPPDPKDPAERLHMIKAAFGEIYGDMSHKIPEGQDPGMHTTHTVDYAVVLEGEMTAVMDEGEVLMKVGDVLIQRGTHHSWQNRSDANCRMLYVLIDARCKY